MSEEGKDEVNGFHANGSVMDGDSLDSLSEQLDSASLDATELDSEPATSEPTGKCISSAEIRWKREGRKAAYLSFWSLSWTNIDIEFNFGKLTLTWIT